MKHSTLTRTILGAIMLLFVGNTARGQACDVYVTEAGGGSGASFGDATTLQSALGSATSGDVVCVATGRYSPGSTLTSTFNIPGGVTVAGGFAGTESSVSDRVANFHAINPTILDGDWDDDVPYQGALPDGDPTANYKVVTMAAPGSTLDGLIVEGGNDSRPLSAINPNGVGGGVTIDGGASSGMHATIQNSVLRNNHSTGNGASVVGVNANYTMINTLVTQSGGSTVYQEHVAAAGGRTGLLAADPAYVVTYDNVTIAGNGGQAFFDAEANSSVQLIMDNSIFYNNGLTLPANSSLFQETIAEFTNVVFDQMNTYCVLITCVNVTNTDPGLATDFQTLTAGSVALDYGDGALYAGGPLDGAGRARVQGTSIDAGWAEGIEEVAPPSADPDINLSPASPLSLGTVLDNGSPVAGSFSIQNTGLSALSVTSISNDGTTGFAVSGDTPGSIGAGSSMTVNVTFTPTSGDLGTKTLTFTIDSDDPDEASVNYVVTADVTGAAPNILANGSNPASTVSFGVVQPSMTANRTIQLGNDGTSELTLGAPSFSGADAALFQLVGSGPTSVGVGDSQPLEVQFVGSATDGTYSASLDIPSNDPDDSPFSVPLQATVSTNPPISAQVIPFPVNLPVPAGAPALDVNDYAMLAISVGTAANPVTDLFGISFELAWDADIVDIVPRSEWESADNNPAINQVAEDQEAASQPVVGLLETTAMQRSTFMAAGDFLSSSQANSIVFFENMDDRNSGGTGEGRAYLSASLVAPKNGVDGHGVVLYAFFRVQPDVIGLDATGTPDPGFVASAFQFEDVRITTVETPGGEGVFGTLSGGVDEGPFQVIDRVEKWPGDTNDDGEVSIAQPGFDSDVFVIGQCFMAPSTPLLPPDYQNIKWEAKDIVPEGFPTGYETGCAGVTKDIMFADADGDGETDQADVLAIGANNDDSQSAYPATKTAGSEVVQIATYEVQPADFENGRVVLEVLLGEEVSGLYGFASTIKFPAGDWSVEGKGGTLLDDGNLLTLGVFDDETGTLEIASTRRYPAQPVSGSGSVLTVELVARASLPTEGVLVEVATAQLGMYGADAIHMNDGDALSMTLADAVGVEEAEALLPTEYSLGETYPNPFGPVATVSYALPEASEVKLAVYDVLGRQVRLLVDAEQAAGRYEVQFESGDLSSGTYFVVLKAGNFSDSRTAVLVK